MYSFKNKKGVILGSTGLLGSRLAKKLSKLGADLILHGRSKENLKKLDNQIKQLEDIHLQCPHMHWSSNKFHRSNTNKDKSSRHVFEQFYNCWLSRYLTPADCIYDNGSKFIGTEFKDLLNRAGINKKPTTIKNPTANAICERIHDTIAMMLWTKSKTITEEEHA